MKYPRLDPQVAMPLSGNRNILFLWLPKCAGCSIRDGLRFYFGTQFEAYNNQVKGLMFNSSLRCATFYHSHIPSLISAGWLPISWVNNAFSFCCVRNTWDRMVSLFFYLRKMNYTLPGTFDEFIKRVVAGCYPTPGYDNLLGYYQANSLLAWLRPNGKWIVDHICRFENLVEEWRILCYLLGVPLQPLPVVNKTQHRSYQSYYTCETRDLVGQHFAEEIEVFDFQF